MADENKVIAINNNIIISGYDALEPISREHSKLIVSKNGKFGIVDINEIIVLPIEYDKVWNKISHGPRNSILIVKNGKVGLFNHKNFQVSVPPIYDEIIYINDLIIVKKQGKSGIITEEGKVLCDFIYDEIYPNVFDFYSYNDENRRIYAKKENSYFQIDKMERL